MSGSEKFKMIHHAATETTDRATLKNRFSASSSGTICVTIHNVPTESLRVKIAELSSFVAVFDCVSLVKIGACLNRRKPRLSP